MSKEFPKFGTLHFIVVELKKCEESGLCNQFEPVLSNCKKSEIGFEDLDLLYIARNKKNKENYKKIIYLFSTFITVRL
jgi:hypothetical protein